MGKQLTPEQVVGSTRNMAPVERDSTIAGYAKRMHERAERAHTELKRRAAIGFALGVALGVAIATFAARVGISDLCR